MTPDQIDQVQESFGRIAPRADDVAAAFYARLFATAPHLQGMFKSDVTEQGRKLMQALTLAVMNLRSPERILQPLKDMGRRHRGYGVTDDQYAIVGGALLSTLRDELGDDLSPECEEAWGKAYTLVADVMKAG